MATGKRVFAVEYTEVLTFREMVEADTCYEAEQVFREKLPLLTPAEGKVDDFIVRETDLDAESIQGELLTDEAEAGGGALLDYD